MRPLAPHTGKRCGVGARPGCVLTRRWYRIGANALQDRYQTFKDRDVINPGGDRQQAPPRPNLLQRVWRAPAQQRFGVHRTEPVARGFVQPCCI